MCGPRVCARPDNGIGLLSFIIKTNGNEYYYIKINGTPRE